MAASTAQLYGDRSGLRLLPTPAARHPISDPAAWRGTLNAVEAGRMGAASDPGANQKDRVLLAAAADGDRQALGELYDRHARVMLQVALRFLRSRRDAEDLLHDVFVEAWEKASAYDAARGTVRRWLLMRIRSRAIDRLRSLQVARRHAMADAEPATTPLPEWDVSDRARARRAILDLPPAQRTMIELSYFEGLTCAEMAAHCRIPIGTVKSRMSAAMTKLRHSLVAPAGVR